MTRRRATVTEVRPADVAAWLHTLPPPRPARSIAWPLLACASAVGMIGALLFVAAWVLGEIR